MFISVRLQRYFFYRGKKKITAAFRLGVGAVMFVKPLVSDVRSYKFESDKYHYGKKKNEKCFDM